MVLLSMSQLQMGLWQLNNLANKALQPIAGRWPAPAELFVGHNEWKIKGENFMTLKIPHSSQFHFFMMPDETNVVLKFIAEQQCAIYPTQLTAPEPHECDYSRNQGQMFFCPRDISAQITTYRINNELYTIDRTTSPVIEFDQSYLRADGLSQGRIYFHGGYDGREHWVAYPESLYAIYKKVVSFMKKTLLTKNRKYPGYVSKGSLKYVSEGGCLDQF